MTRRCVFLFLSSSPDLVKLLPRNMCRRSSFLTWLKELEEIIVNKSVYWSFKDTDWVLTLCLFILSWHPMCKQVERSLFKVEGIARSTLLKTRCETTLYSHNEVWNTVEEQWNYPETSGTDKVPGIPAVKLLPQAAANRTSPSTAQHSTASRYSRRAKEHFNITRIF